LFLSGDTNLHTYVLNDPVNSFDPYGLDWLDKLSDFSAGLGDVLSLGITRHIRRLIDVDDVVNCSTAYNAGEVSGVLLHAAIGAGLALEAAAVTSEYTLTQTVENNLATRPYLNSPLLVKEIESTGLGVPDPGGIPGALRYDVPGGFNKSEGIFQLVIHPETNTIYHFLFTSGP
jgi:hypothetical protein